MNNKLEELKMAVLVQERTAVTYRIVKSICTLDGAEGVTVYGVEAALSSDSDDYVMIEDISSNKNDVEQLLIELNIGQVPPDQLTYILEDYIVDLYSKT